MKLLGIHYYFPPAPVVASRRLFYLYRSMDDWADEITVLTAERTGQSTQEPAYQHQWPVIPLPGKGLREQLFGREQTTVPAQLKSRKGYQQLAKLRQSFPFVFTADEGGKGYQTAAKERAISLVEERGITHLLSSYRPWADHLVASRLAKRYPQLHWWADFRDLPVDPVRKDVYWPGYQTRVAKKIVAPARGLLAVSAGQAKWLRQLHPRVEVVYSGLTDLPRPSAPVTDKFVINYTGSYYPALQALHPLVQALAEWRPIPTEVSLQYAGKDGSFWRQAVSVASVRTHCQFDQVIPQSAARERQAAAAVNLLLSWSAKGYHGVLTAKLYDYLVAGRPILAIVNGPDDPELRAIVEGSKAGRVFCKGQFDQILPWLRQLYHSWSTGKGQLSWRIDTTPLTQLQPGKALRDILES